jgi:magnesium chelatase family protein
MIRVKSFVYLEGVFQSVEIEVISQKGLPSLQFVGLPDQVIKESAIRIKSAIRSSGYEWPQAKQIIVNLKPSHLKKTSRGLEFAVATAILLETRQLKGQLIGKLNGPSKNNLEGEQTTFLEPNLGLQGDIEMQELIVSEVSLKDLSIQNLASNTLPDLSKRIQKDLPTEKINQIDTKLKNTNTLENAAVAISKFQFSTENIAFYGELDLEGNVFLPEDFKIYNGQKNEHLFTGKVANDFWCSDFYYQINSLKDLNSPQKISSKKQPWKVRRPQDLDLVYLTARQKELLQICVMGEHHLLMVGPAGSGKSLLADVIHSLRKPPTVSEQTYLYANMLNKKNDQNQSSIKSAFTNSMSLDAGNFSRDRQQDEFLEMWRPLVKPHHSITLQGLIGGGISLNEGELSRAHLGTLVFDELLEYKPPVVESLREPLETGKARVARSSGVVTFESRFLWIATSNLCPCGDYVPGKSVNCRYSLNRCRSYGQKLSGPLVDRFDLISFSNEWCGDRAYSVEQISDELNEIRALGDQAVDTTNLPFVVRRMMANWDGSYRRKKATMNVASTIARLNKRTHLTEADVEKALNYTVRPFASLQRWD